MLETLKPELSSKFSVRSIGIFGSLARGTFINGSSDIDLIVDFKKPVGVEFIDLADYLENKLGEKVDLVSKNGIKEQYLKAIESEIVYV